MYRYMAVYYQDSYILVYEYKYAKNNYEREVKMDTSYLQKKVKLVNVSKICPQIKRSLERWLSSYHKYEVKELIPKSTRPKINSKETPIIIKERVIKLREEKKECDLKLKWYLEDECISVNERTMGRILKSEGLTRRYKSIKIKIDILEQNYFLERCD